MGGIQGCPVSRAGYGRMGQLGGHPRSQPSTGMGLGSSPCAPDGPEVLYINDGLRAACPMGSKQNPPNSRRFKVLPGAFTLRCL